MKKALILLAMLAASVPAFAQASSAVVFRNNSIATSDPNQFLTDGVTPNPNYVPGGNGNGSYDVRIWEKGGLATRNGAGDLPGGVKVALFYQGQQLAETIMGTTGTQAGLFGTPRTQDVVIGTGTGAGFTPVAPGSRPELVIRAWQGTSLTFDAAKAAGNQFGEWTFTSPPVSGVGSPPSLPPTLTGWGPVDGSGLELQVVPEPSVFALGALGIGALLLRRRKQ